MSMSEAKYIHKRHSKKLLKKKNVNGTWLGFKKVAGKPTGELSIVCSVKDKIPLDSLKRKDRIPKERNGIPTDVVRGGEIKSFQLPQLQVDAFENVDKMRPAQPGCSLGHFAITAGTFGFVAHMDDMTVMVTNNHVGANSNDAAIGDAWLQPGPHDGGKMPNEHIANLLTFEPIKFMVNPDLCKVAGAVSAFPNFLAMVVGSNTRLRPVRISEKYIPVAEGDANLMDVAIGVPLTNDLVLSDIIEIGAPTGLIQGELGAQVHKSGRTTGHTHDYITGIDGNITVNYGGINMATFEDQLIIEHSDPDVPFGAGGDSGSAILVGNRLTGLLFAGSETMTIANKIQHIFDLFDLNL